MLDDKAVTAEKKLTSPGGKKRSRLIKIVLITVLVLALVAGGWLIYNKQQQKQIDQSRNAASDLEIKGSYTAAAQKLIEAYNKEGTESVKASLAYQIGINFYDSGYDNEGKKWLDTAISHYKKTGNTGRADNTQRMIERYQNMKQNQGTNKQMTPPAQGENDL